MEPVIEAITTHWFGSLGIAVAIIWIIAATIESVLSKAGRERSRREIAAYIAEGSMTADEGERLLNAGKKRHSHRA